MAFTVRLARRLWLATAIAAAAGGLSAQTLAVRADSGRIRVSAPKLRFLDGKPLERLRDGASVVFAVHLTLFGSSKTAILARASGRFAVSFDLWEEKFAVTQLATPRKSVSHLSALEAEAWCLDSLALAPGSLSPDSAFWVRLDVRAENPEDRPAPGEEPGVTLARLVEVFSRPQGADEPRTQAEAGPFHLKDLH
jgi:hypothetical protein